jgi:hypothetical protein
LAVGSSTVIFCFHLSLDFFDENSLQKPLHNSLEFIGSVSEQPSRHNRVPSGGKPSSPAKGPDPGALSELIAGENNIDALF